MSFPCKQPAFNHVFCHRCPTLKKIHMTLNATDSKISTQFSRVLTFSNPVLIPCNQPAFIKYFTHGGQSPDRQQPIEESSLKYYPFLLFNVSSLIRDRNISLVRIFWTARKYDAIKTWGFPVLSKCLKWWRRLWRTKLDWKFSKHQYAFLSVRCLGTWSSHRCSLNYKCVS